MNESTRPPSVTVLVSELLINLLSSVGQADGREKVRPWNEVEVKPRVSLPDLERILDRVCLTHFLVPWMRRWEDGNIASMLRK